MLFHQRKRGGGHFETLEFDPICHDVLYNFVLYNTPWYFLDFA